jgi:leucyl aminopeptidase (aminopeptidase T)
MDEKAYGTAHIAIGLNTAFGGKNKATYHHDIVFFPSIIEIDGKKINIDWLKK